MKEEIKKYDIIVIGAGSGGLGMSGVANAIGLRTLLIEKEERNVGGDCLNFGCVPSKALIHVARHFKGAREARLFGLETKGQADLEKVLDYVHQKQAVIRRHENVAYLRDQGIDVVIGHAQFTSSKIIQVENQSFTARRIVLATGSRPRHVEFEGLSDVEWYNNESLFYDLKKLPGQFLIVGGGPIGCEMAQAFQRLGSEVTIINRSERLLKVEREEMSAVLEKQFRDEGIKVYNSCRLLKFTDQRNALVEGHDEKQLTVQFDAVLIAIGRDVNIAGMGFHNAGIEVEKGRITVNKYLRTTNSSVYLAGDAAGMYKFSHGAEKHVRQLARNFFLPWPRKHHMKDLSWVTFTDPEVASFGLTEEFLEKNKIKYWRQDQDFSSDDRAITGSYTSSRLTLFLSPKSVWRKQRILGGSMVAPGAGEIIQELLLASNTGMPVRHIFN